MQNTWLIIGRGKAGWYADGVDERNNHVSSSGGDLNPYTYWTGVLCKGYREEAQNDALVYDATDAPYEDFAHVVISGPMKNVLLAPFDYEAGFGGIKGTLSPNTVFTVESLKAMGIGSLSYIGLGIYESLLRQIPSIKFGYVLGGGGIFE